MVAWLKSLTPDQIETIVNIAVGVISILGAVVSVIKSIGAHKAAKLAKQYAADADAANKSAKEYYDKAVALMGKYGTALDEETERKHQEDLKKQVLITVWEEQPMVKTEKIAQILHKPEDEIRNALKELRDADRKVENVGKYDSWRPRK